MVALTFQELKPTKAKPENSHLAETKAGGDESVEASIFPGTTTELTSRLPLRLTVLRPSPRIQRKQYRRRREHRTSRSFLDAKP